MKIDKLDFYHVAMPLISPFNTAFGDTHTVESVVVKLTSGNTVGWGEAAPWRYPAYSPESTAGTFLTMKEFLAPLIIGKEIKSGEELQAVFSIFKGNQFAKGGIDQAWWDCEARLQEKPLCELIGGSVKEVDVGADFGVMENFTDLLKDIAYAVKNGFKRVKLKYRPGWELDMIKAVRKEFPDHTFHVDCNSAYTLKDKDMLTALDDYNLAMVEQPLMNDDIIDHAALQRELKTPICLDETINHPEKARKAIQMNACGWINIKPCRVGGITNAIAIHNIAMQSDIPCWIGGMLESSIGGQHCLALSTLPNIKYPSDIFPTDRFYTKDLGSEPMEMSGPGTMLLKDVPGIGVEADAEMLEKLTIDSATSNC
ncbi:MAG: o-succinylbenzoate synthase [Planctomycetota bacterium]|jgi:O-succinylbenzoate synthase